MAAGGLSPAIPLRGRRGAIKWYAETAADVADYTVVYSQERHAWTVRGGVGAPNPFTLQQRPLVFVAFLKAGGRITWPIDRFHIQGGRLQADLGPPAKES